MDELLLKSRLKSLFPALCQNSLLEDICEKGHYMVVSSEQQILDEGNFISVIPLVFNGSIKVIRVDGAGNELFLYYIKAGESCAITLSSCLKREKSSVKAIVQNKAELIALPVGVVYEFVRKYPTWNDFVLETFNRRFDEILQVLDDVCFHNTDFRLVKYLQGKSSLLNTKVLNISHKEIAVDLNTSREVVSRLLKQLEGKGAIELLRGRIRINDIYGL